MLKRFAGIGLALVFAFTILFVSVLRSASINYAFCATDSIDATAVLSSEDIVSIDYPLPYPGKILPNSALWPLKALRDRVWLTLTTNQSKRARLMILFADKRLEAARILFEQNDTEIAYTTLTKAEKYLDQASSIAYENNQKGQGDPDLCDTIANASLKHMEVIQNILKIAPEDMKPQVIKVNDYPGNVYKNSRDCLRSHGLDAPQNPFNGE